MTAAPTITGRAGVHTEGRYFEVPPLCPCGRPAARWSLPHDTRGGAALRASHPLQEGVMGHALGRGVFAEALPNFRGEHEPSSGDVGRIDVGTRGIEIAHSDEGLPLEGRATLGVSWEADKTFPSCCTAWQALASSSEGHVWSGQHGARARRRSAGGPRAGDAAAPHVTHA